MPVTTFENDIAAPYYFLLGAGAIGKLWATRLNNAGAQVCFITRNSQAPISITLNDNQNRKTKPMVFNATSVSQLKPASLDGANLVIATKAHQATHALAELVPSLTDSTNILALCNGVGVQQAVLEILKQKELETTLYWGVSSDGALINADQSLQHTGVGVTHIGCLNKAFETQNNFTLPKNFGLAVQYSENIKIAIWHKFFINCAINPATVRFNCKNGELLNNAFYADFFVNLCKELQLLYNALQLAFVGKKNSAPNNGLQCELPAAFSVYKAAKQVAGQTTDNISSMLRDTRNGKVTEIASLNGYLVEWANNNKLPCPLNQQLLQDLFQHATHN